jgi:hypothetical protein
MSAQVLRKRPPLATLRSLSGWQRIAGKRRDAVKDKRRRDSWDHFSWYVIKDKTLAHDVEVLLIRMLPLYLRHLTRQRGHFKGAHSMDQKKIKQNARLHHAS